MPLGIRITDDSAVERALTYLKDKAPERAAIRAARIYQEKYLKALLARLFNTSKASSVAAKEMEAEASNEYAEALVEYRDIIRQDEEAREFASAAQLLIEIWRTEQSNKRSGL